MRHTDWVFPSFQVEHVLSCSINSLSDDDDQLDEHIDDKDNDQSSS